MTVATEEFLIDLSADWHVEQGGGRLVAHDSAQRELILSVTSIARTKELQSAPAASGLRAMVIDRALEAARIAASHSELDTLEDLSPVKGASLSMWRARSISKDRQIFFAQLVFAGTRSVGLLTFEASSGAESEALFTSIERAVRLR
jgi:hypothetical protein